MTKRQLALGEVITADPDVYHWSGILGAGSGGNTGNNGRFFITLKPFAQRTATAQRVIARLRPKIAEVEGGKLVLQAAADRPFSHRVSNTLPHKTFRDGHSPE